MHGLHQIGAHRRGAAAVVAGIALAVTLSSCGEGVMVAASLQFTLSAPTSITAKPGSAESTPLLVTVAHLLPTPITVPISLTIENPPLGVHAEDVTVGIGQASATLNVFVDSTYAGAATSVLTIKGTALNVSTQKVNVTLQIIK